MFQSLKPDLFFANLYFQIMEGVNYYAPLLLGALIIVSIGLIISILVYKLTMFVYVKFNIGSFIDKLELDLWVDELHPEDANPPKTLRKLKRKLLTQRVKLDQLIAKSFSYYIFLVFFRLAVVFIGIKEVEKFLWDLIGYLPNLFIGVVIWFFGIRFSDTVYDVIYHTLEFTRQKTSKIIAMSGKIIILFFTVMLVLNYLKIVDQLLINTFIIWFVATITLACGLAFGLGGKDVAKEILESFRK